MWRIKKCCPLWPCLVTTEKSVPTSLVGQTVKRLQIGRPGFIPVSGRFPGEGNGNPLQYSCLENPMDGGAWCRLLSMGSQRVGHDWATSQGSLVPPLNVLICWWGPGIPNVKALQMILMLLRDGNYCSLIMTANLALLFEVLLPRRKERRRPGQ